MSVATQDGVLVGRALTTLRKIHPEWSATECADRLDRLGPDEVEKLAAIYPHLNGTGATRDLAIPREIAQPTHALDHAPDLTENA